MEVGLVYTTESIMIAAGVTVLLVLALTIFAFQVLSCFPLNLIPFLTCSDQGWLHRVPRSDGLCAPGLRHLRLHHDLCSLHQAQFWSGRRFLIQTLSLQSHGGGLCGYRSHHILNLPCYRHPGIQLSIIWYLREEAIYYNIWNPMVRWWWEVVTSFTSPLRSMSLLVSRLSRSVR